MNNSSFDSWLATIRPTNRFCSFVIFLINLFFPGIGTMFNQCCCGKGQFSGFGVCIGFLQLLLAPILIGWIWSIWWGVEIMRRSGVY